MKEIGLINMNSKYYVMSFLLQCVGVSAFGSAFQHPFCGRKHSGGREKARRVIARQVSLSDWKRDYISFVVCFCKLKVNCLFPDEKLVSPAKEEKYIY